MDRHSIGENDRHSIRLIKKKIFGIFLFYYKFFLISEKK
jgi:hypothetical protein